MESKRTWPLSTLVAFHCTWIVALFMGLYGWAEVAWLGESVVFTTLRHSIHVVLIFVGLLGILERVLTRLVARPIRDIGSQLYRLGAGAAEVLPVDTRIRELRQIVDAMDLMRRRMHAGETGAALKRAEAAVRDLRAVAADLHPERPGESERILDATVRIGETFGGVF